MSEKRPDMLEMLIRHELALKERNELFAILFQNRQDFWKQIAGDEQNHSDWLETLWAEETLTNWFISDSRLKPQAIRTSIGYVETQIARARKGGFSLLEALSISKDLESALIEKQLSIISDSVPEKIKSILMDLAAETRRHREIITEAPESEKRLMQ